MNLAHKGVRSSARRQQNLDMQQTYPGPKPLQVSFRQNLKYTYMRLNFNPIFTPFGRGFENSTKIFCFFRETELSQTKKTV